MSNIVREIAVQLGISTDVGAWKQAVGTVDQFNLALESLRIAVHVAGEALDSVLLGPIERADQIRGLADRTGLATDAIQELGFAADQTNTSAEALSIGVRTLTKQAYEASKGGKESGAVFKQLGIAVKGADGKVRPITELLADASDKLMGVENDTERTALAMKLFGRAGAELQPFLAQGSAKIKELSDEAQALGFIMGEDLVNSGDELRDTFSKLRKTFQGLGNAAARGLIPWIQALADRMVAWFKINGQLLRQGLEGFFSMIGHAIEGVGRLLAVVVNVFEAFVDVMSPLAPLLADLAKGLLVLGIVMWGLNHPILAIGLAFVAALDEAKTFIEGGDSIFDDFFANTDGWIHDAGVFALSFLAPFIDKESRENVKKYYSDMFDDVLFLFVGFQDLLFGPGSPGEAVTTMFGDMAANILEFFQNAWKEIGDLFTNGLAKIQGLVAPISNLFGGGAAGPSQAAGAVTNNGGTSVSTNQQNTVNVNVSGGANGATPYDMGAEVARAIEESTKEQNRQAFAAFAPAGAQ